MFICAEVSRCNDGWKLTVIADLFPDRLESAYQVLSKKLKESVDVPQDHRFIGSNASRNAINSLRPGDVAMRTGYSGFRPAQLEYAVEKGINVFMEKSFAPDAPGLRHVIQAHARAHLEWPTGPRVLHRCAEHLPELGLHGRERRYDDLGAVER
jgi:hypothetical protein